MLWMWHKLVKTIYMQVWAISIEKYSVYRKSIKGGARTKIIQSTFSIDSEQTPPHNSRKRPKQESIWQRNINKKLRQAGKAYKNWKKHEMPPRALKAPCKHTCFFLCTKHFTPDDRQKLFAAFWNLVDDDKAKFFHKFVKRTPVKRRRNTESHTKVFSYKYFLQGGDSIYRVCRTFFSNTLNISKQRIYYCFENLTDINSGCPMSSKRGKNIKTSLAPEEIEEVRNHIQSFETVDSHYCRANTKKVYLESDLNLNKMYHLYVEATKSPVKLCSYRKIRIST